MLGPIKLAFFNVIGTLHPQFNPYDYLHRRLDLMEESLEYTFKFQQRPQDVDRWHRAEARLWEGQDAERVELLLSQIAWLPGARLYYTLEALGRLETLHGAVFAAIHKDRLRLNGESAMREWAITQGIAGDAFSAAWHGFGTEAKVLEAQRLARQAGIAGVPALVVDGRYLVLTGGTYGDLLHRAERLIAHAREERAVRPALAPPVTQELTQ